MTSTAPPPSPARPPAGLLRRLGALLYDSLLIVALLMIATAAFLPLTGGEAVDPSAHPVLEQLYRLLLLLLVVGYYGLFWTRGRPTLGMASWRLEVERDDGRPLTWRDTALRLAAAVISWLPLGLGFLWVAIDPAGRAWHDRLSGTRMVLAARDASRR